MSKLYDFQLESNKIEGIKFISEKEVEALRKFINCPEIRISDLTDYVKVIQPNAIIRDKVNVSGVRVGNYVAPPSGSDITEKLQILLNKVNSYAINSYYAHVEYETLHPFTDGNGRSGRALWFWMRNGVAPLGFLHHFYYETLENSR